MRVSELQEVPGFGYRHPPLFPGDQRKECASRITRGSWRGRAVRRPITKDLVEGTHTDRFRHEIFLLLVSRAVIWGWNGGGLTNPKRQYTMTMVSLSIINKSMNQPPGEPCALRQQPQIPAEFHSMRRLFAANNVGNHAPACSGAHWNPAALSNASSPRPMLMRRDSVGSRFVPASARKLHAFPSPNDPGASDLASPRSFHNCLRDRHFLSSSALATHFSRHQIYTQLSDNALL